jgi:hypothetical protein
MTVVVGQWGTAVLDRWRGRGGRRTGQGVAGCSGEAVAGVGGAGGRSMRAIDGRSSWWMERTAQRRPEAFSPRMAAQRRDSYSEATHAHEDGGAEVGRCWWLDDQHCMATELAETNERVGVKVLK